MPEAFPPDAGGPADPGEAEVLEAVRTLISEVIGDEYVSEIDIGLETSFYTDIEIESIELVALGEKLQARFGDRVDFAGWLATMDVDDIIAMTVGDLVRRIATAGAHHETPSSAADPGPEGAGSGG